MNARKALALLCSLAAAGCAEGDDSASPPLENDVPSWTLTADPTLEIGVGDGESHQLDRVRGALRLPGGNIAVLDGGSGELRLFTGDGRYLSTPGRKGAGPGEFQMPWTMYRRGDTIFVADTRLGRLSVFQSTGEFIATAPPDLHGGTGNVHLYDASVVIGPSGGGTVEGLGAAIRALPRPEGYIREVWVGSVDRLWLRVDTAISNWLIVDAGAGPVARLTLPPKFTPYEIGSTYVLGLWEDSLGVQSIRSYMLPGPSEGRSAPVKVPSSDKSPTLKPLREFLSEMGLYQEYYYSRPDANYTYAGSVEELMEFVPPANAGLKPLAIPAGTVVRIMRGDRMGWFAVVADTVAHTSCAVGVGFGAPVGWTGGTTACF